MTNRLTIILLTLCLCASAQAKRTLTILHTNDTHSTVMPLSANLDEAEKAGRGGYLRRLAMIEQMRETDKDLLLFDCGDFSQGSPYYTLFRGDVETGLMGMMGYDAATIGNHEFDFGLDNLARLIRSAKFPFVCANYDFSGTPVEGLVRPYVVLRRKGLRIGVFGLSPKMEGLVSAPNCAGVGYRDPVEAARETVAALRGKERCDIVICLSHLGWEMMPPDADDAAVVRSCTGIDLVLGGHTHTYFEAPKYTPDARGRQVPVNQMGKHAIYVGHLTLTVK